MAFKNFSLMIHGVTVGKIRDAFTKTYSKKRIRHPNCKADPPRWGVIGLDCQARALELVAVKLHSGDVLIVHANYLTDRKSTRLNSSHVAISYAVFCLKKKMTTTILS